MATSAFRSTTRRSTATGSGAANSNAGKPSAHYRRSRSLTRSSGRFPMPEQRESGDSDTRKGIPANDSMDSSAFLDISLDDLADEFFRARAESDEESEASFGDRARSGGADRGAGARYRMDTVSSRQRGRSVSRPAGGRSTAQGNGGVGAKGGNLRRRSLSGARQQNGDLENDVASFSNQVKMKFSGNTKSEQLSQNPAKTSHGLRRSMSDRGFLLSHDSNSSHSSLTDDEALDFHPSKYGTEGTIYALEKAAIPIGDGESIEMCEVTQKEVTHAVDDIRTELEKSQKRKQDLMALLAAEEERGQELSQLVNDLPPSSEKPVAAERQTSRKRSDDRMKISKCLTKDAERYLEDFLSNVEDTSVSSFDEERSDTGSSLREHMIYRTNAEKQANAFNSGPSPADAHDVVLPWLRLETYSAPGQLPASGNISSFASQEDNADSRNHDSERSPRGSNIKENEISSVSRAYKENKIGAGHLLEHPSIGQSRVCSFNMEEYLSLQQSEDFLFERLRYRKDIDSGSMLLCRRIWL